jgi:hypothetical protein
MRSGELTRSGRFVTGMLPLLPPSTLDPQDFPSFDQNQGKFHKEYNHTTDFRYEEMTAPTRRNNNNNNGTKITPFQCLRNVSLANFPTWIREFEIRIKLVSRDETSHVKMENIFALLEESSVILERGMSISPEIDPRSEKVCWKRTYAIRAKVENPQNNLNVINDLVTEVSDYVDIRPYEENQDVTFAFV